MKLVEWLKSCRDIADITACTVTIGGEKYEAARYKQTLTAPEGSRNPGPYTRETIYCIGKLPKCYLQNKKKAFTLEGDQREWYIAGYCPDFKNKKQEAIKPQYEQYNPFGPNFLLMPWQVPDGTKIDHYEEKPYTRVPISVNAIMEIPPVESVKTREQAHDLAVEWQHWQSKQSLSYEELAEWQGFFEQIATKFDLTEEFKENGII